MSEFLGDPHNLAAVALKALVLFLVAVVGFRVAERRTLAEMNAFDFVAAVAVGSIVGRVPNATDAGFLQGTVTLVVILAAHALLTRLRLYPHIAALIDHTPRLLVLHGEIQERQMKRSGLTRADLFGVLRMHGIRRLREVRYVIFEQRGSISVIREDAAAGEDGEVLAIVTSPRMAKD